MTTSRMENRPVGEGTTVQSRVNVSKNRNYSDFGSVTWKLETPSISVR